jgi:hypothetical protein
VDFYLSGSPISHIKSYGFANVGKIFKIILPKHPIQIDSNGFGSNSYLQILEFSDFPEDFILKNSFGLCLTLENIEYPQELSCEDFEIFDFLSIFEQTPLFENKGWCNSTCNFSYSSTLISSFDLPSETTSESNDPITSISGTQTKGYKIYILLGVLGFMFIAAIIVFIVYQRYFSLHSDPNESILEPLLVSHEVPE